MLKHKKQIEILEDYLGEHAEHFEWSGLTPIGYTVKGRIADRFKVTLAFDPDPKSPTGVITLRFYPTQTGSLHTVCEVDINDPNGPKIIEERVGLLIKALTPLVLEKV